MIRGDADYSLVKPKKKTGRAIQPLGPSFGSVMPNQRSRDFECEGRNLVTHGPGFFGCGAHAASREIVA
jgi:hypothetical protein